MAADFIDLAGRVSVVTGGSRGIGAAAALELAGASTRATPHGTLASSDAESSGWSGAGVTTKAAVTVVTQ